MNPLLTLAIAALLQGADRPPTQPPASTGIVAQVPLSLPNKYMAKPLGGESIVAKVDGQPVHVKDVEGMVWESMGQQATDDFINLMIVRHAAVTNNLTVTQAEIEKQVDETLAASDEKSKGNPQRPAGMSIEAFLARQGLPLSRIYLNSEVEVTLDKIAAKNFAPASYVKLSVIAFRPADQTAAAVTTASQKATAAAGKLKLGQKWSDILKGSDDPENLKAIDGQFGWADLRVMPADLQKQLANLKVGGTTEPVAISNVFQIFRVDELGASAPVKDVEELKRQYIVSQRAPLMTGLIKNSKVERLPVTEARK